MVRRLLLAVLALLALSVLLIRVARLLAGGAGDRSGGRRIGVVAVREDEAAGVGGGVRAEPVVLGTDLVENLARSKGRRIASPVDRRPGLPVRGRRKTFEDEVGIDVVEVRCLLGLGGGRSGCGVADECKVDFARPRKDLFVLVEELAHGVEILGLQGTKCGKNRLDRFASAQLEARAEPGPSFGRRETVKLAGERVGEFGDEVVHRASVVVFPDDEGSRVRWTGGRALEMSRNSS